LLLPPLYLGHYFIFFSKDVHLHVIFFGIGHVCDVMNEYDKAAAAYEYSLRHNPFNVETLTAIANILNKKHMYGKAAEYLQRAVKADPNNGEAWAALAYTVSAYCCCRKVLALQQSPQSVALEIHTSTITKECPSNSSCRATTYRTHTPRTSTHFSTSKTPKILT
jgi:tetratricopeptide (TPR) repeat protein